MQENSRSVPHYSTPDGEQANQEALVGTSYTHLHRQAERSDKRCDASQEVATMVESETPYTYE
eukprot:3356127-Amphidinium_carterae.1